MYSTFASSIYRHRLILALSFSGNAADRHMTLNAEVGGITEGTVDCCSGTSAVSRRLRLPTPSRSRLPEPDRQDPVPVPELRSDLNFIAGAVLDRQGDGRCILGGSTFLGSGDEPAYIAIAPNGFSPGGGQQFDIFAQWSPGMSFSKLLLVYNDANTDIAFTDVFVTSEPTPFFTGPSFGPLQAAGALAGPEGQGTVAAIPEPGAFVMLAAGLLALGFAARRRRG
jgi:hypothetical protein